MKFSCEKSLLQSAIATTSRTVSSKSSIPALEGLLIEATSNLRLTGYNLETGIRTTIGANIQIEGSLVLSARIFGEIIRKLPDDIIYFSAENHMVNITCGKSKYNILGLDAKEFPELPIVEDANTFTLEGKLLGSMIDETLFAISDSDARPILTGSLFELEHNQLTLVSVDGYRLALRRETIHSSDQKNSSYSFVVPGSALNEVQKICGDKEDIVTVSQGTRHIMFQLGETILISRRLEGEFLPYKQAIPRQNPIILEGNTRNLITSMERVSLIIEDKMKQHLRCVFGEDELHISSKTAIGDAEDRCEIIGNGQNLEIGFNNRYLMEALRHAPTDRVRIELNTGITPCILLPVDGEEVFVYMILPVRIKNDG